MTEKRMFLSPLQVRRAPIALAALLLSSAVLLAQVPAPANPAAAPPGLPGIGDLLVAPTRVVFEGRARSGELTLLNIGKQAATYRISFTHFRMLENGDLKEVEQPAPGDAVADDLIRYSPRQVTLEPNVSQTIRLQVRKPEKLADGEYRSHLLFRAVPPEGAIPGNVVETEGKKAEGYSIRLTPIYGVSIPVIVRQGQTSVKASLADLSVMPPGKAGDPSILQVKIHREGNQSVYGNLQVTFVSSTGREQVVGTMNGLAVYTPIPDRIVRIALQPPPGVTLEHGRLRVSYARAEQKGDLLAEAETALP
jgi:hypothetical protein